MGGFSQTLIPNWLYMSNKFQEMSFFCFIVMQKLFIYMNDKFHIRVICFETYTHSKSFYEVIFYLLAYRNSVFVWEPKFYFCMVIKGRNYYWHYTKMLDYFWKELIRFSETSLNTYLEKVVSKSTEIEIYSWSNSNFAKFKDMRP